MTAVTARVWVGECHFDHVACESAEDAVRELAAGTTVVVPSFDVAREALELFGAPVDEVAYRIDQARRRNRVGATD